MKREKKVLAGFDHMPRVYWADTLPFTYDVLVINFLTNITRNMSLSPKQDLLLEAVRALDAIRNKEGDIILEKVSSAPNLDKIGLGDQYDVYTTTVNAKKTSYLLTALCNCTSQDYETPKTRALTDFDSPDMKDTMIHIFWKKYFISVGLADLNPITSKTEQEECCKQLEQNVIY